LHLHAFIEVIFVDIIDAGSVIQTIVVVIEVIFADIVDAGNCYTNYCGCSRK
jgi:hypothetical protein